MAEKIKKYGKKALIFGLILILVAMYVTIPSAQATTYLAKERDTLSDSRPSTIAKHTVIFQATTAVPLSGHVVVNLPDGFTTPAMDYTDVAIYFDAADPPTTECLMAAACDGTHCCVTVTTATDTVDFTLKSGAGITAGWYVKVVIGDGASGGWEDISNPSGAGASYDVDITTRSAVPADIDIGRAVVYIIAGVTVSATVSESLTFARVGLASCTGDTGTIDATIDTSGNADTVPFGTLGSNFTVACQQLTVTTNATNGYVVTEQEDDQLRFDSTTFPDTTCDSGTPCANADSNAAAWLTDAGFGHGCQISSGDGVVCAAAYGVWATNKYYRQFASIADTDTAQALMTYTAGAPTQNHVAIVHYKIKKSAFQAAGIYQNAIVYIATPTY